MNNKLTTRKVLTRTTHEVVANFTNGFAQNVIELDDGTVLSISYSGDSVTIEKTEPIVLTEEEKKYASMPLVNGKF